MGLFNGRDLYNKILKRLDYREIYILSSKFIDNYTLLQIGTNLNISKERVRQIIKKSLFKIYKTIENSYELNDLIYFIKYFIIVNYEMIENYIKKNLLYLNNNNDIKLFSFLIINSLVDKNLLLIKKLYKYNFYYWYKCKEKMEKFVNYIYNNFYNNSINQTEIYNNIKHYIININKSIINEEELSNNLILLIEPLYKSYITSISMENLIYQILKKENRPMHYTEISIELEKIIKKTILERYIHNILINSNKFCWAGNGYYVLCEWGYKKNETEIIDIIINMIINLKRYVTTDEIYDYILSKYKVNKQSIYMALKNYEGKKIKKIGNKLWGIIDNEDLENSEEKL